MAVNKTEETYDPIYGQNNLNLLPEQQNALTQQRQRAARAAATAAAATAGRVQDAQHTLHTLTPQHALTLTPKH